MNRERDQEEKFRSAARELGADESGERFDAALRGIGTAKPEPKKSAEGATRSQMQKRPGK